MGAYYTVFVPWVPAKFRTKWHPLESDKNGPYHTLCRGSFKTEEAAIEWAIANLMGTPYRIEYVELPKDVGNWDSADGQEY